MRPSRGWESPLDPPAAGEVHTCVVHRSGRVSCFGRDSMGQLGLGTAIVVEDPQTVLGL
ncbi:MAG: hypothetical protein HY791_12180 [Deltaproteobacteria bacterium]|nr:hypothetical protein [Deltaproteobacteria bacterium]